MTSEPLAETRQFSQEWREVWFCMQKARLPATVLDFANSCSRFQDFLPRLCTACLLVFYFSSVVLLCCTETIYIPVTMNFNIDTDIPGLVQSNSLSTNLSTPSNASSLITLDSIFRAAELSPPTKSYMEALNPIISRANKILDMVDKEGWARLSKKEQVQLAFLIWKKQDTLLLAKNGNNEKLMAERMLEVFDRFSDAGKALEPFLRAGGDEEKDNDADYFSQFLREFPEWRNSDTAVSIFHQTNAFNQQLLPFVLFQTFTSMVCFLVSAANAILYYMIMTTGTARAEAIALYGLNIGRFMRNNLTDEQLFEIVFCKNGGFPDDVLESLLVHSIHIGSRKKSKTNAFNLQQYFSEGGVALVYANVKTHLKAFGPLLVCDFRMFPKYTDKSIKTFGGSWDSWKDSTVTQGNHAFLITGVDYTNIDGMGGIWFQVQDSLPGRPFVNIGLELLITMCVSDIVNIKENVVFQGTTNDNCFDGVPLSITSGSPRAVPKEVSTKTYSRTEIGHLSSIDSSDSAAGQTESTAGDANHSQKVLNEYHSQKVLNEWPLDFDPKKDTTNMVFYT